MMEQNNQIIIYQTVDGQTAIDVRMEAETVWLSANQMAELFDRDAKTIRKHINNVFSEGELYQKSNTQFLRVAGVDQPVAFYNLDVIISVGYRVKSQRGVEFRRWANKVLKEYLVKGFAVNQRIESVKFKELNQLVAISWLSIYLRQPRIECFKHYTQQNRVAVPQKRKMKQHNTIRKNVKPLRGLGGTDWQTCYHCATAPRLIGK